MLGFTPEQVTQLQDIQKETLGQFQYNLETTIDGKNVLDYWPTSHDVLDAVAKDAKFQGICSTFAVVCMDKAKAAGYNVRLVVCYDELKEGHCICEVACTDESEAYYFDNRRQFLATLTDEKGYQFLGVSPWNPVPSDPRPWNIVEGQPTEES
jgi:hypothetical protein